MKKKIEVDNIIFLNDELNIRAGGPSGYLANLKYGIETFTDASNVIFITKENLTKCLFNKQNFKKVIVKSLTALIPVKKIRKQYREALKINKLDPSLFVLIANTYFMNNEVERSIFSYRAAVNLRPENDEYKLVFIQVLEDFINETRKDDLIANF